MISGEYASSNGLFPFVVNDDSSMFLKRFRSDGSVEKNRPPPGWEEAGRTKRPSQRLDLVDFV
jgi:hypothetical protein